MYPILQRRRGTVLLLCLYFSLPLCGQITLSPEFSTQLDQNRLQFLFASDTDYKAYRNSLNDYLPCDFAVRSRRERLQIRYLVEPLDSTHHLSFQPDVLAGRMLTHLAQNNQAASMTMHQLSEEEARQDFGADWASIYFFPPKREFSDYQHCRMLVLYREGQAMAYVFYLFNKPPLELNDRLHTLQFQEAEVVLGEP